MSKFLAKKAYTLAVYSTYKEKESRDEMKLLLNIIYNICFI